MLQLFNNAHEKLSYSYSLLTRLPLIILMFSVPYDNILSQFRQQFGPLHHSFTPESVKDFLLLFGKHFLSSGTNCEFVDLVYDSGNDG